MKKTVLIFLTFLLTLGQLYSVDYFQGEDGFLYLKISNSEKCESKDERGLLADFDINKILDTHFLIDENEKFSVQINRAAAKYDVDPFLIKAFIKVESDFNDKACSSKGAIGLMQLMPDKAPNRKINLLYNPCINIDIGVKYIAYLKKRFNGNATLAIASYNAGPTIVQKLGAIPPFKETRNFVKKIRWFYSYYKNMSQEYRKVKNIMNSSYQSFLKENFQKSIILLAKAEKIMPDNGYIYFNMGLAYAKIKIDHISVEYFKKAISCNPYIKEAYYNLGILYAANQNRVAAGKYFKRYNEIVGNKDKGHAMNLQFDRQLKYP
ncbi:transglycosylase SLT domain-containing protein [bacterium]|nr:transglycosylase SLT domain-containing protein [bacterium]